MAQVSSDLRTIQVDLLIFDAKNTHLKLLGESFTAANEPQKLSEMGESFLLRGVFDDPSREPGTLKTKALQQASRVHRNEARPPLKEGDAPVKLTILYDGKVVPIEYREGRAFVPEAQEGQEVALRLTRNGDRQRYAVVLKVNGENTLSRQRKPDLECRKWVFDPDDPPMVVEGFQTNDSKAQKFRVMSPAESRRNEVNYGADVGTIVMTVFREATGPEPTPDLTDETTYEKAVSLGDLPADEAANYHALKAQLLEHANRGGGLLTVGETIGSGTQRVKFQADPIPVMSVTVVYYHPQR